MKTKDKDTVKSGNRAAEGEVGSPWQTGAPQCTPWRASGRIWQAQAANLRQAVGKAWQTYSKLWQTFANLGKAITNSDAWQTFSKPEHPWQRHPVPLILNERPQ